MDGGGVGFAEAGGLLGVDVRDGGSSILGAVVGVG